MPTSLATIRLSIELPAWQLVRHTGAPVTREPIGREAVPQRYLDESKYAASGVSRLFKLTKQCRIVGRWNSVIRQPALPLRAAALPRGDRADRSLISGGLREPSSNGAGDSSEVSPFERNREAIDSKMQARSHPRHCIGSIDSGWLLEAAPRIRYTPVSHGSRL